MSVHRKSQKQEESCPIPDEKRPSIQYWLIPAQSLLSIYLNPFTILQIVASNAQREVSWHGMYILNSRQNRGADCLAPFPNVGTHTHFQHSLRRNSCPTPNSYTPLRLQKPEQITQSTCHPGILPALSSNWDSNGGGSLSGKKISAFQFKKCL